MGVITLRIEQLLNIPAAFLYSKIIDAELFEIKAQTGEALSVSQLQGFIYDKQLDPETKARVRITKNILNQSYHYEMTTKHNKRKVSYDLTTINADQSRVVYQEQNISLGLWQQLVDVTRETFLGALKRRNFRKMFLQIEKSY